MRLVEALVGIVVGVGVTARRLACAGLVGVDEPRRSASVSRRAASAPQAPSSAAITSNRSMTSRRLSEATNAPRRGCKLDQPRRGQLHQRLADRGPRDAETRGQALLVQPLAGTQGAGDDVLLELVP